MKEILISTAPTSLEHVVAIAREGARVRLTEDSRNRVANARRLIEQWVREGRTIYGVTTGFGALSDVVISKEDTRQLQENVLLSHAAGIGRILDEPTTRAVMGLRIKDFARGYSGVRLRTVEHLIELLNRGVHPVMPEKGPWRPTKRFAMTCPTWRKIECSQRTSRRWSGLFEAACS